MSDAVKISVSKLVNKRELYAVIAYQGRIFNAQLDLGGAFSIQSDDLLPIPLLVLWHGYIAMHGKAIELFTGETPKESDPVKQITIPIVDQKPLIELVSETQSIDK